MSDSGESGNLPEGASLALAVLSEDLAEFAAQKRLLSGGRLVHRSDRLVEFPVDAGS